MACTLDQLLVDISAFKMTCLLNSDVNKGVSFNAEAKDLGSKAKDMKFKDKA